MCNNSVFDRKSLNRYARDKCHGGSIRSAPASCNDELMADVKTFRASFRLRRNQGDVYIAKSPIRACSMPTVRRASARGIIVRDNP